jgi:hypothetical protein
MHLNVLLFTAVAASQASAWKIHWLYTNKQLENSNDGCSDCGCKILNGQGSSTLDSFTVDWATSLKRDPNRVRLYSEKDCKDKVWEARKPDTSFQIPNMRVRSYRVDRD